VRALEELAKHYEHRGKNYSLALEMTRAALGHEDTTELRRREDRLARRCKTSQQKAKISRKRAKPKV
jgi:hypothetical protein